MVEVGVVDLIICCSEYILMESFTEARLGVVRMQVHTQMTVSEVKVQVPRMQSHH